MKNLLTAIIFALVVGLLPVNAYAADGKYKGLKIIKILIEKLESNEKKCNFTKDTIKTTASFPIVTGTKLKIKKNSQMYFYISIANGRTSINKRRLYGVCGFKNFQPSKCTIKTWPKNVC